MILRICLCIPCYDNPTTIAQVVAQALEQTALPVLVVDDGSQVPVTQLLRPGTEASAALESGRLRVVRFARNQGKGHAIRAAVTECISRGFTHLVTVDGDGQHLISEVNRLLSLAHDNPWDLIIGQRRLQAPTVPQITRVGRAFSNFWVNYHTGAQVKDTQSGLRVYPLFHLQRMPLRTTRYEFETEVLTRLAWKGVRILETEIDVHYPAGCLRITHFRTWVDTVRLVLLNTVFVLWSLAASHFSAGKMALALCLGTVLGGVPLGVSLVPMVGLAALLLRLNGVVLGLTALLAQFISAVFEISQGLSVGESVALSGGVGVGVGGVAYGLIRGIHAAQGTTGNWNGRSRGGAWGIEFLRWLLRVVGLRAGYSLLMLIVPYFYVLAPKARRALHEYWAIMSPNSNWVQRVWLTLCHMQRFGQVLMDRAFAAQSKQPPFHAIGHGMDNLTAAVARGQGLILLSAHVGGWDLATAALVGRGIPTGLYVLRFADGKLIVEFMDPGSRLADGAASNGARQSQPIMRVRELLAQKQAVALMGDRPLTSKYELVRFLGHLAPFDVTAFRIAAATGASVLVCFGFKEHKEEGKGYHFFVEPARQYAYTPGDDRAGLCQSWAQEYATTLEHYLRKYPDQWFNFFPFWTSLPTTPLGQPAPKQSSLTLT